MALPLKIHFNAKFFAVIGNPTNQQSLSKLLLNGRPVVAEKGQDVKASALVVTNNRLYGYFLSISRFNGYLQLIPEKPGLEIYTFTFG